MNILIIEDEKLTGKDLSNTILQVDPRATIMDIIGSVEEGKKYLLKQAKNIDLIFADIQLGDGLSFEIFERLHTEIPIIFCTAYDEYALQAFKSFGIDYILKPFSKETVASALNKLTRLLHKNGNQSPDYTQFLKEIKNHFQPVLKSSIILYQGDKIIPIESEKIAFFFKENELVYAITFEQKKLATRYKLDVLEKKLSPQYFRANRQFLVNRKAVKEASQYFHRKLLVHLTIPFAQPILIGKEKVTSFLDWLSNS